MSENNNRNPNKDLSPCIRNCCLNENDVCLGCYRTLTEITGWRSKTRQQQLTILDQCSERQQHK